MALQPMPFHIPQANILNQWPELLISRFLPSAQTPVFTIILLTKPSVAKIANAIAYTKTQLMKLGMVVKVCTNFLTHGVLISDRKIANAIAHQLVASPSPLMAKVLRRTRIISFLVASLSNNMVNHLNPTKLSAERVPPEV